MACRRSTVILALLALVPAAAFGLGFEAVTLGFAEAWTGNGYVPTPDDPGGTYDFEVTGSEPMPIDPFVSVGVRFGLLAGFESGAVMGFSPALQLGWRRYLLLQSGRVVPAQIEAAAGAEGNTPGVGSADVLTVRLPLPLAFELRFGGNAVWMSISPTLQARLPVWGYELSSPDADLSGMFSFFYDDYRFVTPEAALGYRFRVSDHFEATIHATYGLSVMDVLDTSLPWYDQMRIAVGVDLGFIPPFGDLTREREGELPPGVEPFPEDQPADG
jgi:hypothetical protein